MAYDEALAERVRALCPLTEKKMFGGLAFLLGRHLAVCVVESELVVRLLPAEYDACLREPGVRAFDFTGKVMTGWVVVPETTLADDGALADWVERGTAAAGALPPK